MKRTVTLGNFKRMPLEKFKTLIANQLQKELKAKEEEERLKQEELERKEKERKEKEMQEQNDANEAKRNS